MAVAIALAGVGSAAASPFEVDSTDTADSIEIKCAFELRESSGAETRIAPKFALAMPLSDHLEFEAGTMRREVIRDGASRSGLGDTTLEFKWRFASETHHRPALAVIPELSLPTGSKPLEPRLEEPEVTRFVDHAQAARTLLGVEHCGRRFRDDVHVRLRVDAARYRQAHEFERGMMMLARFLRAAG